MTSQQDQPQIPSSAGSLDLPPVNIVRTPPFPPVTPPRLGGRTHVPPPLPLYPGYLSLSSQISPIDLHFQGNAPNVSIARPFPALVPVLEGGGGGGGSSNKAPPEIYGGLSGGTDGGVGNDNGRSGSTEDGSASHYDGSGGGGGGSHPEPEPDVYELLARPLRPCEPEGQNHIHNLLDASWVELPSVAELYSVDALQHTKKPTLTESLLRPVDQLQKIVFMPPQTLDDLQAQVANLLRQIPIDLSNDAHRAFLRRISPWENALDCPKRINSEVDTEDWTNQVIFRPALAIVHALVHGSIFEGGDSEPQYPFLSSAHSSRHNKPDGTLTLEGHHPHDVVCLCIEDKTQGVFSTYLNPLRKVQLSPNAKVVGAAHKFNWPKSSADLGRKEQKGSRIVAQIWSQLIVWKARWGILTSMDATVFYGRNEAQDNTLYLTGAYDRGEPVLFLAVCWILMSSGLKPLTLPSMPTADTTWWTRAIKNFKEPGFITSNLRNRIN